MQAFFPAQNRSLENRLYHQPMARRRKKGRSEQGEHLANLRKQAGLTQVELAELLGVPQSNVAYWEQSEKPPRSDVLPQMAHALGVRIEQLLLPANGHAAPTRAGGPKGKVRKLFEEVSRLPRRQQEKIVEFVSAFVRQYEHDNDGKSH
jgi:transcriptional regulator with XRE-family HTH domain